MPCSPRKTPLRKRTSVRQRFPDAAIFYDAGDDSEWRTFERKPEAALGLFAGPPCQPFAMTGKGLMDDDPRARHLLESVGDAVSKLLPVTIVIGTVSSVAGANDGAILRRLDDYTNQHGYT